ncbi:hypothetical protein M427DRAFT_68864 [Gonapodya prolifera JEL478]|uniref:Uncharacterized protein n=1 Tax=Gonapodya prolifera (strain JEL478) TaxID=1344416 RepID=A0A139AJW2_GONPJ|nr:hypothetical protein M427DRAFT_68864 [Gonapodya prolifera JEL478]|eukprot:KXS16844.1 hypothetical protein M427DRAFT_68864 [Gonapodya prolifera JEL478]
MLGQAQEATIVVIAIAFGLAVVMLLGAPYICCCIVRARRKQYAQFETDQKVVAAVLLALNLFCLAVAVLCGFLGSTLMSSQLQQVVQSTNNTMTDASLELTALPPAVSAIITDVYTTIDLSVSTVINSVGLSSFVSLMGGKMGNIVSTLVAVDGQLKSFNATGRLLGANATDVKNRALIIGNQTNAILSSTSNLNNQQNSPSGASTPHLYQLLAPISVPGTVSTPTLSGMPDVNTLLSPLNSVPDLGALARSLNLQFNTSALNDTANSFIDQGLSSFKSSSRSSINGITGPRFNWTGISVLLTPFNTSQLDNLNSSLVTLSGAVTVNSFSYTPAATPSDQNLDVADFRGKIGLVTGNLSSLETSQIAVVNGKLTMMAPLVTSMQSTATSLNTNIGVLVTQYNDVMLTLGNFAVSAAANITAIGIPGIVNNFGDWADRSLGRVNTALNCEVLAKDSYAIQNGVCTGIAGALDASWLAFYIEGFCIIFGVPIYVIAANRLAHRTDEDEKESIPVKSGATNKPAKPTGGRNESILTSRPFPSPSAISGPKSPAAPLSGTVKTSDTTPRTGAARGDQAPNEEQSPTTASTAVKTPESPTFFDPDSEQMKFFATVQQEAAVEALQQPPGSSSAYVGGASELNENSPTTVGASVIIREYPSTTLVPGTMQLGYASTMAPGLPLQGVSTTVFGTHEILTGESPDIAPEALLQPALGSGVVRERRSFVVSETSKGDMPEAQVELVDGSGDVSPGDLYEEAGGDGDSDDSD